MKKDPILRVLDYFSFFSYPPTIDEIHTFMSEKISRKELVENLKKMAKNKKIVAQGESDTRYTFPPMFKNFDLIEQRSRFSSGKMKRVAIYLNFLKSLKIILLTGISGSVAMKNAARTDDVDLFIITIPNRLWTARLSAIILALLLGMKRNRKDTNVSDKVCLNLFFDGKNVKIPDHKQNEYVAHELLQLKPVIDRKDTYTRLLQENKWILSFFPNAKIPSKIVHAPRVKHGFVGDIVENLAKKLQMFFIKRHMTKEFISDTQLWFYPKDFEVKLKKKIEIKELE